MTTELYPFQREGVDRMHEMRGRCILADVMGLGKTIQALYWIKETPGARPVVIVCPASLKSHWQRQAAQHLGMRVDVVETGKPPEWGLLGRGIAKPKALVISYDLLDKLLPYLILLRPQVVVGDEAQMLCNPKAKRTKAMRTLLRTAKVPHFIPISGTPIMNAPIEFWSVLNMLHPKKFPSYHAFGHKWTNAKKTPWGWEYKGAKNADKLHRILTKRVMIRRLKKDVLKDLPDKQRIVVPIAIDSPAEYKRAERDFRVWVRHNYGNVVADKTVRAEALARTTYLKKLAAKLKLAGVKEWVANFLATGEKLIIFATHKSVVKEFATEYAGRCAVVTGSVPGKDRQAEFDRFNADPKCVLFIGNLQAAGAGWSASKCSTVAKIELGWNPGTHLQAEDRVHGIKRGIEGVKSQIFYLVADGTIETRICGLIVNKSRTLDSLLDGKVVEDMSVFDELMGELAKEK